MASVLDIGLLNYFMPAISFLFIFAVVYAILDKFELLGKNKIVKAAVAFTIGLLFILSKSAMEFVNFTTPWFIVLVIVAFFILFILMFIGLSSNDLAKAAKDPAVYWTVIVIGLLFISISIVHVFGQKASPYGDDQTGQTRESEGLRTLVHPRVLGAIFLLIIATFAVRFISSSFGG